MDETARQYDKQYDETLVKLERAQAGNSTVSNRADQSLIQLLEQQRNDATQQLNQLHAGHAPSAAEGQLAAQQSQNNEQLEALHKECDALHEAAMKACAERDTARKANLKKQMASLTNSSASASETALHERCTKAEARVDELQKENTFLKEIQMAQSQMLDDQDLAALAKEEATATSAALGPLSFPALSGRGRAG